MTRRRNVVRPLLILALGVCTTVGLAGCASYRMRPTPGVTSLNISRDRNKNRIASTFDTNLRAMMNDLSRVFLLDRPSRLTKQPSPY